MNRAAPISALVFLTGTLVGLGPSTAEMPVPSIAVLQDQLISPVLFRRGFIARGPRGGFVAGRTVHRRGHRGYGGGWRRPGGYWWRPGAAVAAGAAIGFVGAATAAAWAGAAPAPGFCWYYTSPSRQSGFWDPCPR